MLYVGFFDFHYEFEDKEPRWGTFIYFADAKDPDGAIDVFKKGIKKIVRKRSIRLYGDIFLKSFVELIKLPPEGAMAFLEDRRGNLEDLRITIGRTLPGKPSGLESYEWFEDGKEQNDDEENEMTTFLTIPAPAKKARGIRKTAK
jgi:hypothetical protein